MTPASQRRSSIGALSPRSETPFNDGTEDLFDEHEAHGRTTYTAMPEQQYTLVEDQYTRELISVPASGNYLERLRLETGRHAANARLEELWAEGKLSNPLKKHDVSDGWPQRCAALVADAVNTSPQYCET